MRLSRAYRQYFDGWLLLVAIVLIAIGFLSIYSATHTPGGPRYGYVWRFAIAFGVGLGAFAFCLFLPLRLWEDWAPIFYGLALALLVGVLFLGVEEYGARRWFPLGPLRFQPSELAKLALVVFLASRLSGKRVDIRRASTVAAGAAFVVVPFLLVIRQPDLGTAGAYVGIAVPMLLWAGLPRAMLLLMASPIASLLLLNRWIYWTIFMVAAAVLLWRERVSWLLLGLFLLVNVGIFFGAMRLVDQLEPYQQKRITAFLDPEADKAGAGYQVEQSRIAIGSGRLVGKGYLQGTQSGLAFLPQQHTDFIFSVVGEEWGFVGSMIVVLLFAALILRGVHLALNTRGAFASFLALGLSGLIFYHATLNMAMTMGLFPVTGLPLPFVSYGGSFLITMMAALGLLENVAVHRYDY